MGGLAVSSTRVLVGASWDNNQSGGSWVYDLSLPDQVGSVVPLAAPAAETGWFGTAVALEGLVWTARNRLTYLNRMLDATREFLPDLIAVGIQRRCRSANTHR